jgi:hypothetical protein
MRYSYLRYTESYAYVKLESLPSANTKCKPVPIISKSSQNIYLNTIDLNITKKTSFMK